MLRRAARDERLTEIAKGHVDAVLGHRAMGRPLPSQHADQTASLFDLDFMVADEFLGVESILGFHQRPHAGKSADYFFESHRA